MKTSLTFASLLLFAACAGAGDSDRTSPTGGKADGASRTIGIGVNCTTEDGAYSVTVLPLEGNRIEVELFNADSLVDDNRYSVEELSGDAFLAVDLESDVIIEIAGTYGESLGDLSVYYYNGLTGLSVDFAPGRCDIVE
jgi:hypothetical protein